MKNNHVKTDSGNDINDKFMAEAGFYRSKLDRPDFNACGNMTYWTNDLGLILLTDKKVKIKLAYFVLYVANQAAYWTRRRVKERVSVIDCGEDGFVRYEKR